MMASKTTWTTRAMVVAGAATAVAAGAGAMYSDQLLSRGFGNALDTARSGLSFELAADKAPAQVTVGDESYWLTKPVVDSPTPFAKTVAIGDRITITNAANRERRLEVIDVKLLESQPDGAARPKRLLIVTCRVTGESTDRDATVRFAIEADPPPAEPAVIPSKAL
jgi:hypothetical protein